MCSATTVAPRCGRTVQWRHLKTGALRWRTPGIPWWSWSSFLWHNPGPVWTHQKWRSLLVWEQTEWVIFSVFKMSNKCLQHTFTLTNLTVSHLCSLCPYCWRHFQFVYRRGDPDNPQHYISWHPHCSHKCTIYWYPRKCVLLEGW